MAMLAINGFAMPIADGSVRVGVDTSGTTSRLANGWLAVDRRKKLRVWEFDTPPLPAEEALFYRDLISGVGDHWRLEEHLYSAQGRALAGNVAISTDVPCWGTGSLKVLANNTATNTATIARGNGLTVVFWYYLSAAWGIHCASWRESDTGTAWLAWKPGGTVELGSTSAFTLTWAADGTFTVGGATGGPLVYVADLLAVRRSVAGISQTTRDAWANTLGVGPMGDTPKLWLDGELIDKGAKTDENNLIGTWAFGECSSASVEPGWLGGVWTKNLHRLSVKLTEPGGHNWGW